MLFKILFVSTPLWLASLYLLIYWLDNKEKLSLQASFMQAFKCRAWMEWGILACTFFAYLYWPSRLSNFGTILAMIAIFVCSGFYGFTLLVAVWDSFQGRASSIRYAFLSLFLITTFHQDWHVKSSQYIHLWVNVPEMNPVITDREKFCLWDEKGRYYEYIGSSSFTGHYWYVYDEGQVGDIGQYSDKVPEGFILQETIANHHKVYGNWYRVEYWHTKTVKCL